MRIAIAFAFTFGTLHAQNTLTAAQQRYFSSVRRNLEAAADVMPAEKYSYRLTDGQMTFGEWLIHSMQRNYSDCATLQSETAPAVGALKTKDDVAKALKDSFAYCAAALEKMDDQKVLATPQMSTAFLHIVVHNNEIYGNIVGYLRLNGVVPPSTAGRGAPAKK
jgi:hypothetical protein